MSKLYDGLKSLKTELEEKMVSHGKQAFQEYLSEFFKANPSIEAIRRYQYTPHFNDGDTCSFSYYGVEVKGAGIKHEYESEKGDGFYSYYALQDGQLRDAVSSLDKELDGMQTCLLMAFGDHKQVTATPVGITVEEYEHD